MWIAVVHGEKVYPNEEWFENPYKYCGSTEDFIADLAEAVDKKWQEIFQRFIKRAKR